MAHERYDDKYEGQDEGEYHFSDDQVNYEMEGDATSKDGTAASAIPAGDLTQKLKQHRRIAVGIVVFIVLIGIVYKLVVPSSSAPSTEFSQQTAPSTVPPKMVTKAPPAPSTAMPNVAAPTQPPVAEAQPQQVPPPPQTMPMAQPAQQPTEITAPPAAVTGVAPQQQVPIDQPAMQTQPVASAPPNVTTTVTTDSNVNKSALDRIGTLEQQNLAMMNMLQTQFAQKMTDTEAQNTQMRTQVQELNARVSSMEVAFHQLTKILRGMHEAGVPSTPPARVIQPKTGYTVQAIIPGRAWLKTDAGDTVTVAEGDVLKGLGRITKIDPYDGIVDIDNGNKMITLSYGVSGD
ncbi:MAG: hypothetical protein ABI597_07090 [Gammaproteobacteria bacterium]